MKNVAVKTWKSIDRTWKVILGLTLIFFLLKTLGNR